MTAYPSQNPVVRMTVETSDGHRIVAKGRDAWALNELIGAGMIGITSIETPAPRISHYIFKLRRAGLSIETIDEGHGGAFSGSHARYVLRTPVTVLETVRQTDQRKATKGVRSAQAVAA